MEIVLSNVGDIIRVKPLSKIYMLQWSKPCSRAAFSQPPGRGTNYTGPREILLELITNLNVILYVNMPHRTHNCTNTLYALW